MRRDGLWRAALAAWVVGLAAGAAPAPPSYYSVVQTIDRIQKGWEEPGARPQPNRAGWEAYFRSLQSALRTYATAPSRSAQWRALGRLHQMSMELKGVSWSRGEE